MVKGESNSGSRFHEYALNVTGFLGGITFAAMILIIESKDKFSYVLPAWFSLTQDYAEILIVMSAVVSLLFIVSSVGKMRIAAGYNKSEDAFSKFNALLADIGFIGLVVLLLPAVILPFSVYGASIIVILAIIVTVMTFVLPRN